MPNHVINEVILQGVPLSVAGPKVLNSSDRIDFEVLLPLPLHFWPGDVGLKHKQAFPGTHLSAAIETWGTKWNAYGFSEGGRYRSVIEKGGSTVLTFQTAWGPPRGWIVALFNTLKCDIAASWFSEGDINAHIERYTFAGLTEPRIDPWTDTEIEEGSQEHKRLHRLLWGVEDFENEET